LATGLDKKPVETDKQQYLPLTHDNVRGAYYKPLNSIGESYDPNTNLDTT